MRLLTIFALLLAVGGVWVVGAKWRKSNSTVEITSVPTRTDSRLDEASAPLAPAPVPPEDEAKQAAEGTLNQSRPAPIAGGAKATRSQEIARVEPELPRTEPTPFTRQLVTSLTQLDIRGGAVTPEQAVQWKQGMQQLVQQGAAAVPAIREFLEKNLDLRFDGVQGGNVNGYPSLRAGLFDALSQISGPEAVEVSRQVLRTTADPLEIALLARNLEQQAPGQYRSEALTAAHQTLMQAAQDPANARDVAPLYQVFQTYGDAGLLASLQGTLPQWNYYTTLAMAGLPEGQGVPLLINQVQDPKSAGTTTSSFALQLLAQMAAQYPDAGNALIEQARLNQISASTWQQLAPILRGDQFQFGSQFFDNTLRPAAGSGVHSYHIAYGNQNFYTTPVGPAATADQITQRRALIDQLLGVTANPAAVAALQAARNSLPGG